MDKAADEIERLNSQNAQLRDALEISTSMMEAMMVQLYSWEHEPTVNVRGRMASNRVLLNPPSFSKGERS
jgi:hypothetical protein